MTSYTSIFVITIVGILAVVVLGVVIYQVRRYKRVRQLRREKLIGLVEDWLYEIESTFDTGLNAESLDRMEQEIDTFLKNTRMRYDTLEVTDAVRKEFVERTGGSPLVAGRHSEQDVFIELSRCPENPIKVQHIWRNMVASYRLIYNNYVEGKRLDDFEPIRRQIILLKMVWEQ